MAVALTALVIAMAGTAMATVKMVSGDSLIKKGSLSGNRLRNNTITGKQVNLNKLGTVPKASHATNADQATNAGNATNATNASGLAGHPGSSYLLTGTSGEAWHVVGALGQPTFQNSWVDYGSPFATAGFYVDPIGRVHLEGVVTNPSSPGPTSTVFILPTGYRPPANLAFAVAAGTGSPVVEDVDILTDGTVLAFGGNQVVALDGISFRVS
jgi:hypothetical protein